MSEEKPSRITWMDVLWLFFLLGLAALPPVWEPHKQLVLLAIGVVQLAEGRIIANGPRYGPSFVVLIKILLATLLINHTASWASTAVTILSTTFRSLLPPSTSAPGALCSGPHWPRRPIVHISIPRCRNIP